MLKQVQTAKTLAGFTSYFRNMTVLRISTTKHDEVVDITERVQEEISRAGVKDGLCHLFVLHTTCALTTGDLDPGTDLDFLDALRAMAPKLKYRHPHDPEHTPDHILSSIIGPSLTLPVKDGMLALGTWQRILLVELSGPRVRELVLRMTVD